MNVVLILKEEYLPFKLLDYENVNNLNQRKKLTMLHESTVAPFSIRIEAMSMKPPCAAKNRAVVPVCKLNV